MSTSNHIFARSNISDSKKEMLFSEFHSLLSAGLDFSRSFQLLISAEDNKQIVALLKILYNDIVLGMSLWQALDRSGSFSALDSGVIRIGEQTGKLVDSLAFLTNYYHKKIEQRRMVSSAISYPIVILCTAIVVVIFMLAVIVPMFEQVYSRMGGELPSITQLIISISKKFPTISIFALIIGLTITAILYIFRDNEIVKSKLASIALRTPIIGAIIVQNHQANFCKLLHLLTSSGVPLLYGINMLPSIITFYPYQHSFDGICRGLNRGELFADNLEKYPKLYDKKLTILIRVGEQTNRLSEMLARQGDDLSKSLEYKLRQLGNLLEPLLIMFVGVIVAVILISMYLPMFKLGGVMEQ